MKSLPGTYALVLASTKTAHVQVGRLGILQLQPGYYVYVGSALGPGGLQARVTHHLMTVARPHWHIDYLRAHANPDEIWYCHDRIPWECRWASCISLMRGASIPLAGFGASDCACESHLYFFKGLPARRVFAPSLRTMDSRHPPVRLYKVK